MKKLFGKKANISPGVKASIAFFLASVLTHGISYIVTPIYTRVLSPDEYGQTSVYLTWLQVFGIIAMFCLSYGVFNNGMMDHKDNRDEYSFSMLILSNIITLSFSAILLSLYPLFKEHIKLQLPFVILMCVTFLFQPAYNFWVARQRYELKYKKTVIFSVGSAILSPLVAIICILKFDGGKLYSRIFGAEIVLITMYMGFYIYLLCKSKGKIKVKYWKEALLFNLPLIPHYMSTYLLGSSDKLMISYLVGDSATAYYSIAYSVAAIAMVVWTAVNSSLIPYTYEKCKEKDYKAIAAVTTPILFMFAVISALVIMLAPEVVAVMASADYKEAIYAIPPIVGGVFFQVHYYIYANIVYYYKKPKYVMIGSISAMLLNILLNYFFIKWYGYIAAGYTTLFCYFVQASIDHIAMRKVVGQKVYNMRIIGLMSLIVVAVSLLSNFLYDYIIVRYVIIGVIFILGIIFRKKIIGLFKLLRAKKEPPKPQPEGVAAEGDSSIADGIQADTVDNSTDVQPCETPDNG
ncbi:MAG: oligosaccharide flippase family protein, partial [Clostridiales bacterium]|nr:oligosaccharide flippase family protein [Clostridiales bacterium]